MAEDIKAFEGSILDALTKAGDVESLRKTIRIARGGVELFRFAVRPLSEATVSRCREINTKYKANRNLGIPMPEKIDTTRYRSQLIYEATVPEDRARIWDAKEAWAHYRVPGGVDLVDKVLIAGEKDRVVSAIEELSGFGGDDELEETVKN